VSKKAKPIRLPLNEPLEDSRRKATSMSLPLAIHHRLDVLAERAKAVHASRAEIIAALVGEASLESEELEHLIVKHRKKLVGEVVPGDPDDHENVYSFEPRGPGRPAKVKERSADEGGDLWPPLPDESVS